MRHIALLAALLTFAVPAAAQADKDGVEFEMAFSVGLGQDSVPNHVIGGLLAGGRLRFDRRFPLGLLAEAYIPWGAGGGALIDLYRDKAIRLHINAGLCGYWGGGGRIAAAPGVAWGGFFGAGLELKFGESGALLMDARAYLPEPSGWLATDHAAESFGTSLTRTQFFLGYGRRF